MLTRLTVTDLLGQFANVRRMVGLARDKVDEWQVRIPRNTEPPSMDVIYDVKVVGDTAYLCPVTGQGEAFMKAMAALADRKLEAMSMEAIQTELCAGSANKLVVGWPGGGRQSCVCKIMAITQGGVCTTFLFPGPMDIEKVNEEIAEHRRTHMCPTPDLDCERCERLSGCEILEGAELEVKARRERSLDTDAGTMIQ